MTFPCPPSVDDIVAAQNRDGGWGYQGGGSWTEPTAYALLLLAAGGLRSESSARGFRWLLRQRRSDGGWGPKPGVDQSTWVTGLVLLLLGTEKRSGDSDSAVRWLLRQTGRESALLYRLRVWLLGVRNDNDTSLTGWPWYPGTAAWVAPTALTILALRKISGNLFGDDVRSRIAAGQKFLLSRMCADGGWNHGSSRALGYEAGSYPETTGLALLALEGTAAARLGKALETAESHLQSCRSAEAAAWLRLGLLAHGRRPPPLASHQIRCRNVVDACLTALAQSALEGRNVFLG